MRILVTNDDSISASQLMPLIRACQAFGEVMAVVPEKEQSGKSHSIELRSPFRAVQVDNPEGIPLWTVDSSPADCVRFAVMGLKQKFDLVISGINRGYNMGLDMMYSGTVAAIYEAAAFQIPAIALSTSVKEYEEAVNYVPMVWQHIREQGLLEKHSLYNINIPPQPKGFRYTRQGGPYYNDEFDPIGENLYMPRGFCVHKDTGDLTLDTDCVIAGYISITPLTLQRTHDAVLKELQTL